MIPLIDKLRQTGSCSELRGEPPYPNLALTPSPRLPISPFGSDGSLQRSPGWETAARGFRGRSRGAASVRSPARPAPLGRRDAVLPGVPPAPAEAPAATSPDLPAPSAEAGLSQWKNSGRVLLRTAAVEKSELSSKIIA